MLELETKKRSLEAAERKHGPQADNENTGKNERKQEDMGCAKLLDKGTQQ